SPQESSVQSAIQGTAVVKSIPVKQDSRDAIIRHCIYAARHFFGIGFVPITPKRNMRLMMSWEAGLSRFDHAPFGIAPAKFWLHEAIPRANKPVTPTLRGIHSPTDRCSRSRVKLPTIGNHASDGCFPPQNLIPVDEVSIWSVGIL